MDSSREKELRQEMLRRELENRKKSGANSSSFADILKNAASQTKDIGMVIPNAMGNFGRNLTAGFLESGKEMANALPNLSELDKSKNNPFFGKEKPLQNFDPYSTMDVENKPFYTPQGATQVAGSLISFPGMSAKPSAISDAIKAAGKGEDLLKNVLSSNFREKIQEPLKNVAEKFQPEKAGESLSEKLSGGHENFTKSKKSLIDDIREKHDQHESVANSFFDFVMKQAGNQKLYEHVDPLITTALDKEKATLSKIKGLNVGGLYEKFRSNPNLENAHKLQSELYTWIDEFKTKPYKTPDENLMLERVTSARNQLKNDIEGFLTRHDENSNVSLSEKYKTGMDYFREHVAPYLSSEKLREITRGRKTNVESPHDIFKNPTDTIDREGNVKTGAVNKIFSEMPKDFGDRILYNALGGKQRNSEQLLTKLLDVRNTGYDPYFTEDTEKAIKNIAGKMSNREKSQLAAKIAGLGGTAGLVQKLLSFTGM